MDQDRTELSARLCTAAGMLMEDMSAVAITLPPADPRQMAEGVTTFAEAAADIKTLIAAAQVLTQRIES